MAPILLRLIVCVTLARISLAAQCSTNPCGLDIDFFPPDYQCFQSTENPNDAICTCPDGQTAINAPCRVCSTVNCGPSGVCIERPLIEGLAYVCGCNNGTDSYISADPCSTVGPTTTTTTTTVSTTTFVLPGICSNGGTYNFATGVCVCPNGYTGPRCEILLGQNNCLNVVCANGGVCNPTPTFENGVEIQCTCPIGYGGPNCELIGTLGRCSTTFCQNGGVCSEKATAYGIYAFCQCAAGFTGRCCQTPYFRCPTTGVFADSMNCKFGRYFQCSYTRLAAARCQRGLRYNFMRMQCGLGVSCPP